MGNPKDPYCAACINKINYLKGKYPHSFWADPNEFFTDGPRVNMGSDFGLMPSLFEPGGIVQQEFFIAQTPVIAYKTGGLKDTVFEYNWETNKGNGITFDIYNYRDFVYAVERSMNLFHNKEKYEQCRKNAIASVVDLSDVSRAWCREFYRLKNKIFFNVKEVYDNISQFKPTAVINPNELNQSSNDYIFKKNETEEMMKNQQTQTKN